MYILSTNVVWISFVRTSTLLWIKTHKKSQKWGATKLQHRCENLYLNHIIKGICNWEKNSWGSVYTEETIKLKLLWRHVHLLYKYIYSSYISCSWLSAVSHWEEDVICVFKSYIFNSAIVFTFVYLIYFHTLPQLCEQTINSEVEAESFETRVISFFQQNVIL